MDSFSSGLAEDWLAWRSNFLLTRDINGWNHQRSRRELAASMTGVAKQRTAAIPINDGLLAAVGNNPADAANVQALLDAYEAVFVVAAESDLARSNFLAARQGSEESLLDWHSRLRQLYQRAHPNLNPGQIDASRDLREAFMENMKDARIGKDIWRRRPANYQQALEWASDAAAVELIFQKKQTDLNALNALNALNQTASRNVAAMRDPFTGVCWNCGGVGHKRGQCSQPSQGGGFPMSRGSGGRRGGRGRGRGRGGAGHFRRGGRGRKSPYPSYNNRRFSAMGEDWQEDEGEEEETEGNHQDQGN